jgi:hypothetical protein
VKTNAKRSETAPQSVKTGLPPYVRVKFAKGRTYYYFDTGETNAGGKPVLTPLPAPGTAGYTTELKKAELARWRRKTRVFPPLPRGNRPPDGFDPAELLADLSSIDDLYFIRAGDAVKIGRAVGVFERMVNMQSNNHLELDCICRLPGRGHEERQWQMYFRDIWIRGEWFDWMPEVADAIECARRDKQWWRPTLSHNPPGEQ